MTDPGSPHVIQVIHEIKESVESPHRHRWLENLQCQDSRRSRARRYRDGAIKIMDLLRPELTSNDIRSYEQYYERLRDLPYGWTGERLNAAKRLWEYVRYLDERLSHDRITSVPYETYYTDSPHSSGSRRTNKDHPNQRVRFQHPAAAQQPAATHHPTVTQHSPAALQTVANPKTPPPQPRPGYHGAQWWSGNNYGVNWRPTWNPAGYGYGCASPSIYNRWAQYWHQSPAYTRVWC